MKTTILKTGFLSLFLLFLPFFRLFADATIAVCIGSNFSTPQSGFDAINAVAFTNSATTPQLKSNTNENVSPILGICKTMCAIYTSVTFFYAVTGYSIFDVSNELLGEFNRVDKAT